MTTYYPYERREGIHFASTANKTVKEVAALMRATIRQTAKDGLLPQDWKYSVRYRTASMMVAIDVSVIIPTDLYQLERKFYEINGYGRRPQTEDFVGEFEPLATMKAAEELLWSIHRGYNYDGSDTMTDYFDVRYYGSVQLRPESWS